MTIDPQSLPGEGPILPEPLPADPFSIFNAWFDQAVADRRQPNPNAFTLATVDPDGRPSARIVLCKAVDPAAGAISFFTNYTSRKSDALAANPLAAAVFHWDFHDRQARLEGPVTRLGDADNDAYFASRPWQSRIGSWASNQSKPIASRAALLEQVAAAMKRFGLDPANPPSDRDEARIPRPAHWGGWSLQAARVELWVGGLGRVHDRAAWVRSAPAAPGRITAPWSSTRLQP
jgi:pyridoxamine 5'-phosphate oxidase